MKTQQQINPDIQNAPLFPNTNRTGNTNPDSDELALDDDPTYLQNEGDSNITKEDLAVFESDEWSSDGVDDDQLRKRTIPANFSGEDLDIPGTEEEDRDETDLEDEENDSYSIGGDNHNDLEEDPS